MTYNYLKTVNYKFVTVIILFFLGFNELKAQNLDSLNIQDSIISIQNLNTLQDTAEINDVIVIKIKTSKDDSLFKRLYINGLKVDGLNFWKKSVGGNNGEKTFLFQIDDHVKNLVGSFSENQSNVKNVMPVVISLGNDSVCYTKLPPPAFVLEIKQEINNSWIWVISIIILVIAIVALWKNILKDDNNLYYSLSRTQLFYWTLLFVICYLFVCLKTGSLPDVPASILVILGISVGTTAISKVIDNSNKSNVPIDPSAKSEGWFLDILSDGTSINIQRFQNVIFNLVFGIIFIQRTIAGKVLPSFDDNVLLLLGISSGTYAGLKLTEAAKDQKKDPPPVVNEPPAQVVEPPTPAVEPPKQT